MHAKVREIIDCFEKINEFPRCSGNEAAIAGWLCEWAVKNGYTHRSDPAGNLIIDVPASEGYANAPGVISRRIWTWCVKRRPNPRMIFPKIRSEW